MIQLSAAPPPFSAEQLFSDLSSEVDFHLLDVRNEVDFQRFQVEGPFPFRMSNIPYFDFMEEEEASVAKVRKGSPVRIVCAKEGSALYVAEILSSHGFDDVSYLSAGIKSWGELLTPVRLNSESDSFSLYQFIRPGKGCLSYGVLYDGELAIIDPSRNLHYYRNFARAHGAVITEVIETHAHADHLSGGPQLSQSQEAAMMAHELGADVEVVRNDKITVDEIRDMKPEKIVVSPGPKTPVQAGISSSVIQTFGLTTPILGVCLGHQCIGHAFGANIRSATEIMHGKIDKIFHNNHPIFKNVDKQFSATRYHSLIIDENSLPEELNIIAKTNDDIIMGIEHKEKKLFGFVK